MAADTEPATGALTPREQQVLALLTAGNSTHEIATRLGIAADTVRKYTRSIYRKIGAKPPRARNNQPLTGRQHQILALLAAGNTTPDIAAQLGIAPGTVKTHLTSVYKKIGARNRVQAARYYLDHHGPPTAA
jgi:DNA-binding CsgD family transcriptional regulator